MENEEREIVGAVQSMTVDCVDFWLDGPGDTTVRPIPESRLPQAKALRELILEAERKHPNARQPDFEPT